MRNDDWDCVFMRCIRIQCCDSCVLHWTICAAFLVCASLSDRHMVESYCELVLPFRCLSHSRKARMVVFSFAMSLWVNLFTFVETKLNRVVSLFASEKSLVCGGIAVDH